MTDFLAEARATLRKANRTITEWRKRGIPVDELVAKRDQLREAIASHEPLGRVEARKARSTGTLVGLYRSAEGGIESDPELPWSVVCEDHGGVLSMETRAMASTAMSQPDDWCPVCSGQEDPS